MIKHRKITLSCIIPSTISNKSFRNLTKSIISLKRQAKVFSTNILIVTNTDFKPGIRNDKPIHRNILRLPGTLGYSELNNIAIDYCIRNYSSDYILLLNDDAFLSSDFFSVLKKQIDTSTFDILSPLIMTPNGELIDSFGIEYFRSGYAKNSNLIGVRTTMATGACMIIKTSFLIKMKLKFGYVFNPLLYFYLEDVDFSLRALMIDARISKCKYLKAYHYGSATTGKKSFFTMYQTYRNVLWILIMDWPLIQLLRHSPSIIIVQMWMMLCSVAVFGPQLHAKLIVNTFLYLPKLLRYRNETLSSYPNKALFANVISRVSFRTYNNIIIRLP